MTDVFEDSAGLSTLHKAINFYELLIANNFNLIYYRLEFNWVVDAVVEACDVGEFKGWELKIEQFWRKTWSHELDDDLGKKVDCFEGEFLIVEIGP